MSAHEFHALEIGTKLRFKGSFRLVWDCVCVWFADFVFVWFEFNKIYETGSNFKTLLKFEIQLI